MASTRSGAVHSISANPSGTAASAPASKSGGIMARKRPTVGMKLNGTVARRVPSFFLRPYTVVNARWRCCLNSTPITSISPISAAVTQAVMATTGVS